MKFIDMFAGIGGFRSGLEKAGHECVGYIEWDKYARKSYQAIYNTEGEFTANDIREVKGIELPNVDLWTFGSPCQDISIAGKQKGLVKGGRSSMFFETIRLLKERIGGEKKVPTYLIMENVKALLSSNCGRDFARVLIEMDEVGYDVEWAVLNSADVVPQNRERVYIIGHLRGAGTRQVFPITRKSSETSKAKIVYEPLVNAPKHQSEIVISPKGCAPTLTATDYKRPYKVAVKQVGNIIESTSFGGNPQRGRIYSTNGLAPTLSTMQGGGLEPKVVIKRQSNEEDGKSIAIRKLTPKECWRLQGFSDEQFERAKKAGISDTQLYKQAGNAVTVDVIDQIGKRLVLEDDETKRSSNL